MTFSCYLKRYRSDLEGLREVARNYLKTDISLVQDMEESYLLGGKGVRALLVLLAGRLCGLRKDFADKTAVAIEFIHAATLLHDDVVDDAPTRRHLPSARRVVGNAAAVLTGDFLYTRSSQIFSSMENSHLLQRISDATNLLAEGELLQLINCGDPLLDEKTYYSIISRKTANLFSIAAATAAILQHQADEALSVYGHELGMAFQMIDDCLDYENQHSETGKEVGTDFNEGKMTLPVIEMFRRINNQQQKKLIEGWRERDGIVFAEIADLIQETGTIEWVSQRAQQHIDKAVLSLNNHYPQSKERDALVALAHASIDRSA